MSYRSLLYKLSELGMSNLPMRSHANPPTGNHDLRSVFSIPMQINSSMKKQIPEKVY
jgi:hypothetical protein